MIIANRHPAHNTALHPADADILGPSATKEVERHLSYRKGHAQTPLVALPGLARELGVAAIHVKDEGHRLGLGSFKALGGAYAVIKLVLEQSSEKTGRQIDMDELLGPDVKGVAKGLTFACATDGNHGRSVAQGAQLVGANCAIFVHSGVSDERIAAIAHFGASIHRVDGNYDESVVEAARVSEKNGWITVSDTSWPGYERIPGLVMQGYTAIISEALRELEARPSHIFIQSGVGGIAAAIAGHCALRFGRDRPFFIVVDPSKAACLYESAQAGEIVKVAESEPTVMAMLECYEPSHTAWRVLSRVADAFMTVDDGEAVAVMRRLASPVDGDPAIVAGESGGVGLAGLVQVASSPSFRELTGLTSASRVLLVNTEGATDPKQYERLVGRPAEQVARNAYSELAATPV